MGRPKPSQGRNSVKQALPVAAEGADAVLAVAWRLVLADRSRGDSLVRENFGDLENRPRAAAKSDPSSLQLSC